MPEEKIEKILLYNEQDVVNLYHIYVKWKKYIYDDNEIEELDESIEELDDEIDNFNYENKSIINH